MVGRTSLKKMCDRLGFLTMYLAVFSSISFDFMSQELQLRALVRGQTDWKLRLINIRI